MSDVLATNDVLFFKFWVMLSFTMSAVLTQSANHWHVCNISQIDDDWGIQKTVAREGPC
jgi:hypothetical protein